MIIAVKHILRGSALRRYLIPACAVLAIGACGDDEGTGPSNEPEPGLGTPVSFVGTLAGDGISGELDITIAGSAQARANGPLFHVSGSLAVVSVTGCLYLGSSSCVTISGTYNTDTKALSITAGQYTFTGTYSNGTISGSFTGPGSGSFVAHSNARETVQSFCGTYTGDSDGIWNLLRRGSTVSGVYNDVDGTTGQLSGSASGNNVSITFTGGSASGSISGSQISGTWQTSDGASGTWSGRLNGCRG